MKISNILNNAGPNPIIKKVITRFLRTPGFAVALSSMMMLASGCPVQVGGGDGKSSTKSNQVQSKCEGLSQTFCEKHIDCKYDFNKCQATSSDCNNIKDSDSCHTIYAAFCVWSTAAEKCEKKSTVYKWKQINAPAGSWRKVNFFTVSGDKTHAYAYVGKRDDSDRVPATDGLYYTNDKGATWTRFGGAVAGDGTVRGQVNSGTVNVDWASNEKILKELKPTQKGTVVRTQKAVFLIEGATVKWAISAAVNAQGGSPNQVKNFDKKAGVSFIDVVDVNGIETIAFAQDIENVLWLKRTDDTPYKDVDAPGHPKYLDIMSPDDNKKNHITKEPKWMRAGNTYNKDLLLASSKKNTEGIWQMFKMELPAADGTIPPEKPAVTQDKPVLWPKDGKYWKTDNLSITVIGSLDNATQHEYFAGMTEFFIGERGQIAHHTGVQGAAQSAAISVFGGTLHTSVEGVSNILGKMRVRTKEHGILGIRADAQPLPAEDLKISEYAKSKNDMKDATNDPVPFVAAHNKDLANVFGDDDLSFFWLRGKTPEAGVYLREKTGGLPRP